jgi:hypothetical protein
MFGPKHLHEFALKRMGLYIKQTYDQGMVMNPSSEVCKSDAYPNADFAGMYGHEDHTNPSCLRPTLDSISLLQIVLCYCNLSCCMLHTETTLSAIETNIIALSACCRELFPIIGMVRSLAKATNLPIGNTTMNVFIQR